MKVKSLKKVISVALSMCLAENVFLQMIINVTAMSDDKNAAVVSHNNTLMEMLDKFRDMNADDRLVWFEYISNILCECEPLFRKVALGYIITELYDNWHYYYDAVENSITIWVNVILNLLRYKRFLYGEQHSKIFKIIYRYFDKIPQKDILLKRLANEIYGFDKYGQKEILDLIFTYMPQNDLDTFLEELWINFRYFDETIKIKIIQLIFNSLHRCEKGQIRFFNFIKEEWKNMQKEDQNILFTTIFRYIYMIPINIRDKFVNFLEKKFLEIVDKDSVLKQLFKDLKQLKFSTFPVILGLTEESWESIKCKEYIFVSILKNFSYFHLNDKLKMLEFMERKWKKMPCKHYVFEYYVFENIVNHIYEFNLDIQYKIISLIDNCFDNIENKGTLLKFIDENINKFDETVRPDVKNLVNKKMNEMSNQVIKA